MRVDIEGGKYTYVFEDGRARLLRHGEPSRRDVVGDKVIYCMAAEIAKLRQQLEQTRLKNAIVYGTSHPEIYKTKEDELREQLAAAQAEALEQARIIGMGAEREKQVKLLRKGFTDILTDTCEKFPGQRMLQIMGICYEALATTEPKP